MRSVKLMPPSRRTNCRLSAGDEPPLGAHLITPRCGYFHHGIYVGGGRVVHYSARACSLIRRPLEDVSIGAFSQGRDIWVRARTPDSHATQEIIRRARSRLGENRYRLLTNNCEHFCEWCVRGQHHSEQVETLLDVGKCLWRAPAHAVGVLARTCAQKLHCAAAHRQAHALCHTCNGLTPAQTLLGKLRSPAAAEEPCMARQTT